MGILDKSKKRLKCEQDKATGEVRCESYKEHEDGTKEILASVGYNVDDACSFSMSDMEGDAEEVKKLVQRATPLLKNKCKGKTPNN